MRYGYRITLTVLAIMIVGCMFLGSSYALWKFEYEQGEVNLVKTGCFDIEFKQLSSSIDLKKAYPVDDDIGMQTTPYIFKITNNCSIKANYSVYLNSLTADSGSKLNDKFVSYSFDKDNAALVVGGNRLVSGLTKNSETSYFTSTISQSYVLDSGTLSNGDSHTYKLKLWMNKDATTENNGQQFVGEISVVAINDPSNPIQ